MTHGFQQQGPGVGFCVPKACATPQHGQKADSKIAKVKEPRKPEPRPAH